MPAKDKAGAKIRIGVGGWTYEPWRGAFYPKGLAQKRELEYASAKLTSIEINGTYYGSQKPESFAKWHDETPDDFVFSLKATRYATNRRVLAEAGPTIERFFKSGVTNLKAKLGPINWQFAATKRFDPRGFRRVPETASSVGRRPRRPTRRRGAQRKLPNAGVHCAGARASRRRGRRRRLRIPPNRRCHRAVRLCAHHGNEGERARWIFELGPRPMGEAREDMGRRRLAAGSQSRRAALSRTRAAGTSFSTSSAGPRNATRPPRWRSSSASADPVLTPRR